MFRNITPTATAIQAFLSNYREKLIATQKQVSDELITTKVVIQSTPLTKCSR